MTRLCSLFVAALFGSALATSCAPADACGEPVYGGGATDEAWRTMVDAESSATTGGDAPSILVPEEGQVFDAAGAAPTLSWSSPLASLAPAAARPRGRVVAQGPRGGSPLDALSALVLPSARAHEPPVTGDVYFLKIAVPGRQCPVAALTTDEEWAVDEASWKALRAAKGQDLQMTIVGAYLSSGRISEGPFVTAPRAFRVE